MSLFTTDGLQVDPKRRREPLSNTSPDDDVSLGSASASQNTSLTDATAITENDMDSSLDKGSQIGGKASPPEDALPEISALLMAQLEGESKADKKRFRRTLLVAGLFHLALFFVVFPEVRRETMYVGKPGKVFVMQQTRFKKPPARAEKPQQIPKKKAKRIPIPDPTPDDPEPFEPLAVNIPDIEPTDVDELIFGIPDGPDPGTGLTGGGTFDGEALEVGNGVPKPVAIFKPKPPYTEQARQSRIQGMVIVSGVIDENGDVKNLKVVKGLPLGLDKTTLETLATWKYEPAIYQGKPVAVNFLFSVGFWLQ